MKYKFSKKSEKNRDQCHPKLILLMNTVMDLQLFDFGISCGHRPEEEQNDMYRQGKSHIKWPDGKHNKMPSEAFDFFILVNGKVDWEHAASWYMAVGVFRGVAAMLGIRIRVGADWDGDFSARDQRFHDLPHIEIKLED